MTPIPTMAADSFATAPGAAADGPPLSRTSMVKETETAMSALIDKMRAGVLALLVLTGAAASVTAGLALWPADAAQSEVRVWIRHGESSCRYVPLSEAVGALPCQT